MTRALVLAVTALLPCLALAASGPGCSAPAKGSLVRTVSTRASVSSFREDGVSTVFEKHCGSLDCHGSEARSMRIYSMNGLRLPNDAGLVSGSGATTLDEQTASYQSILTVEPEQTNAVLGGADPETLLVLKKPLGIETHKGGKVILKDDDADRCIRTWLSEDPLHPVDKTACANASNFPRP